MFHSLYFDFHVKNEEPDEDWLADYEALAKVLSLASTFLADS